MRTETGNRDWVRGSVIGSGSFGTVSLATFKSSTATVAVKSALLSLSSSLQNEKRILSQLISPQIVRYLAQDSTLENGETFYNLFLEYLPGGTLADLVRNSGGKLPESEIRRYTSSILKGLCFIHKEGFVHCDIKLRNILVDCMGDVKIADFGLSKPAGERSEGVELRGTPMYLSPESVIRKEHEAPSDVWALGCAVSEMFTGKPVWNLDGNNLSSILFRIGFSDDLPEIPLDLSEHGRDFLSKCFVRDPTQRWSAELLLNHPFVCSENLKDGFVLGTEISPRSALDFNHCDLTFSSVSTCYFPLLASGSKLEELDRKKLSPSDRIRQLVSSGGPDWISDSSSSWIVARQTTQSPVFEFETMRSLEPEKTQVPDGHPCSEIKGDDAQVLSEMIMVDGNRDGFSEMVEFESPGTSCGVLLQPLKPLPLLNCGFDCDQENITTDVLYTPLSCSNSYPESPGTGGPMYRSSRGSSCSSVHRHDVLNFSLFLKNSIVSSIRNEYKFRKFIYIGDYICPWILVHLLCVANFNLCIP